MRSSSQPKKAAFSVMAGQKRTVCPRDEECSCFSGIKKASANRYDNRQPLLHMDECDDPDCIDHEQLKELQRTYDEYTDYDHYERCCDRHMRPGKPGECCGDGEDDCCYEADAMVDDCTDCIEDCDECVEEHQQIHARFQKAPSPSMSVGCEEDCTQCEEDCEENGHDRRDCPQDHHSSWDSCISTCGVCVDSIPLAPLGPGVEFELYGLNSLVPHLTPCNDDCNLPVQIPNDLGIRPTPESMFDSALDHWQTFQQAHHCAPDPCLIGQVPQFQPPQHVDPHFGFTFGCDPTMPGNQYPWQKQAVPTCTVQAFEGLGLSTNIGLPIPESQQPFKHPTPDETQTPPLSLTATTNSSESKSQSPVTTSNPTKPEKSCQWIMPCGNICGAKFSRTEDLKKHVKNSHQSIKGTVTCRWNGCSASFATDAALTGHISKKHIAPLAAAAAEAGDAAEEGAWKCTVPGCTKSFMYKQVRDDHVASHSGGNRTHCPICHQWLNNEGSNFRRHMASHRPENEHMRCKHQHLGCRRKFPRLDNLRRHEACCKYGKRAAAAAAGAGKNGHHHHHGHAHDGHHHHHLHVHD